MFRRISTLVSDTSDDLAPLDSYDLRERRWVNTIERIDATITPESLNVSDTTSSTLLELRRSRNAVSANNNNQFDDYYSVLFAPGQQPNVSHGLTSRYVISRKSLRQWFRDFNESNSSMEEVAETKRYFERCVELLQSLVLKMIVTNVKDGLAEMNVVVDPAFITIENLEVHYSVDCKETLHFIRSDVDVHHDSSSCDLNTKYGAMKALGMVAYELLMRGGGPPIQSFLPSTLITSEGTPRLLLSLDDYDNKVEGDREQAKRQRASDANNQSRISAVMMKAGVPYPLCRFVVDLLGGECSDGLLFRSDNSFESFLDVVEDMKQMREDPEAFIHLSVKDPLKMPLDEMYGRITEQKMLLEVASRVSGFSSNDALFEALAKLKSQNKQQICFVTGSSGCGKSRLVMETKKSLENLGWLFLSCKFDRIVHSEPLSVIASAFEELLTRCLGSSRQGQISAAIKTLMQLNDVTILAKHVPCLRNYSEGPLQPMTNFEVNKELIHYLFTQLIKALSVLGPVALFVDDLHWADPASLDLFVTLTKASTPDLAGTSDSSYHQKPKVLLIGSYRDAEVNDNVELVRMLEHLGKSSTNNLTSIAVRGFDCDTLNKIVSKSLCLPLRRTKLLAETVLLKTGGIPIHIIEFIWRLIDERILCFSFTTGWKWEQEIENCTISESVAEMFSLKLEALPKEHLLGLKICSLFGVRMEQPIIKWLEGYDGETSVDITSGVEAAVELGLVEKVGDSYKFAHDIISQATFDLISADERSDLLHKLVSALIKNATATDAIDRVIFVVVDLINRMKIDDVTDSETRILYATMNDKAGLKALSVPDFTSAIKYTKSGLAFLHFSHWESHHNLMLSLCETSIIALYSNADINEELLRERIKTVFRYAANIDEEFKTRLIWIKLLSVKSLQHAIDESHKLLERLGEAISPSEISRPYACAELLRVKHSLEKKHKLATIMTEPSKIKAIQVMGYLFHWYHHQRNDMGCITCIKITEISSRYGCTGDSLYAIAAFGVHLIALLGDIDNGCKWARMALTLMSKSFRNTQAMPSVYIPVYGFALFWKEPIQATIDPLLHGYQMGFKYGQIVIAMTLLKMYITRILFCGKSLNAISNELEVISHKSARHGQILVVEFYFVPFHNIVRRLKGKKEQALSPLDTFKSNDELLDAMMMNDKVQVDFENLLMLEITISFIFRDMDKAQQISTLILENVDLEVLVYNMIMIQFYVGLTACYSARQSQEEDRINRITSAQKICDKLKSMVTHSRWNWENKFLLLQAECHYTRGEISKAVDSYEASIKSAEEHKFVNEHAIACELAGYFYKEQGDEAKANAAFEQARAAYIKWGAMGKTNLLPGFETRVQQN